MTDDTRPNPARRDFLSIATGILGAVGIGAYAWPFISQMNPSADVLAEGAPVEVELSSIEPGQQIVVRWRSHPIFIVRRTAAALRGLRQAPLLNRLRDPNSEHHQQADYAANWSRSIEPDYLVVVGICTHLGCIPEYTPKEGNRNLGPNWTGGYFCACHGSKYDLAGRVYKGVPAPMNLPVPPYHFVDDKILRIGENPKGSTFDFSSIEQI